MQAEKEVEDELADMEDADESDLQLDGDVEGLSMAQPVHRACSFAVETDKCCVSSCAAQEDRGSEYGGGRWRQLTGLAKLLRKMRRDVHRDVRFVSEPTHLGASAECWLLSWHVCLEISQKTRSGTKSGSPLAVTSRHGSFPT